jgi:hypothetical protein
LQLQLCVCSPNNFQSPTTQSKQVELLNMSGTGNTFSFAASTASSVQQWTSNTMEVTTFFTCQDSVTTTVAYTTSTAPVQMSVAPCASFACQNASPTPLPVASEQEIKSVNQMKSQLDLAGMSGERCLRMFSLGEPQTQADLADAGCSQEVITALLQCYASTRTSATAHYLGHRNVFALFKQVDTCASWQVAILGSHISSLNAEVQQRLAALTSAVKHLTANCYPAPGACFKMIDGINSYEKSYGKAELAALRSTPQGQSVLSLPLTNANILAAKTSIRAAQTSPQATAGASQSDANNSHGMGSATSSSATLNLHSAVNGDISSLRPETRVLSKKMAKNNLSVNIAIAVAHSGKSYTQLTNPWWALEA